MLRLGGIVVMFWLVFSTSVLGVTAFQISDIGTSAEMIGKAGVEGFDTSASTVFQNPAGLSRIEGSTASLFYSQFLKDELKYVNLSMASNTRFGTFAVGFMQARVDDIYTTSEIVGGGGALAIDETVSYSNTLMKLGYQTTYQKSINIGANMSYYSHDLSTVSGTGINMDVGALAYINSFKASISVKNILKGQGINYSNGETEALPLNLTPSLAYERNNYTFYYQQVAGFNGGYHLESRSTGISYKPPWFNRIMSATDIGFSSIVINGGIKKVRINDSMGFSSKYSIGVSLKTDYIRFHFAMESSEFYNQNQHYFFSTDINL
jgi:hypothetical protein